ncbi:hypothetical protein GO730_16690 [Spirosoma sp. HMF3257]|uniref:Uncharacterized protein n=1 Tax=Spirosoma telluris TaxID=2183553 RepID=A0A327NJ12_9BACT|nr:hypothetical protein [Spirosoma telluris]RAI75391.1 hypothetical protein HMF3257_16625 [Spirosoma telluris]
MRFTGIIAPLLLVTSNLFAQTAPKTEDIAAIKGQCGCHDVSFLYAETFSPDKTYTFKDRYTAKGTEWVFVEEESPTKLVIQHLLVVSDSMIVKHWREDWLYQNTSLLKFDQNASWKREKLPASQVKGQWTQKVFEVDDSPRYEGSATWIHADGRHYWESTVDAPLPRREYTKRTDYNVMRRTNHHEIRPDGYIHEQDNDKIIRTEAGDQLLASEKGLNTYKRTDEKECQAAKDWWSKNRAYWADVRTVWNELLPKRDAIAIKGQVKGSVLSRELDGLAATAQKPGYNSATSQQIIRQTIEKFLK